MWPNGDTYVGEFRNGLRHGTGVYKVRGRVYEGEWLNSMRHGVGKEVWDNKDSVCRES